MQTTFQSHQDLLPRPSPATQALRAAKRRRRELTEARLASRIERGNSLLEGFPDWTTNIYQMLDRFASWQMDFGGATFAGYGYGGLASTINDRRAGKNFPIYQTEVDLQMLRFPSRLLLATNGYAMGMLEGLTSYVCGDGFSHEVKERAGKEGRVPKEILAKLNGILDDTKRLNEWHGAADPGLEEEIFQRGEEDGEAGLCLYEDDAGLPRIVPFEPEQVTAPPGSGEEYRFGIYRDRHTGEPLKYWLRGLETPSDGEEYDAEQIVFFKQNCKRVMKRGVPSFSFSTADTLQLADNLRRALGTGAGIQAGIALIRQWETATQAQAQGFAAAFADYTTPDAAGSQVNVKRYGPGGIEDIPKGMQYVNPPNASNAPAHVQILQACLRGATARWNAPEWIGSGDSGTASFATALAIDAPFTKRVIRVQKRHEEVHTRIFSWALDVRCRRIGRIAAVRADGTVVAMDWDDLRKLVEVVTKAPSPEVRNKLEEAQANSLRVQAGWKSRQTVQAEEGLDPDREQANIDAWNEKNAPQLPALPMPGELPSGKDGSLKGRDSGTPPSTKQAGSVKESREEPTELLEHVVKLKSGKYRLLSHDGKNLGTFDTREEAEQHERAVEYYKHAGESLRLDPADRALLESVERRLREWDEDKHKRAADGKFGSGGGGGGTKDGATDGKTAAGTEQKSALSKVTDHVDQLGKEVEANPQAKEKAKGVFARVKDALVSTYLTEMPAFALDLCDQYLFEDILARNSMPGVALATKAVAWGAAKAYLTIRGTRTVKESDDQGDEDLLAIARKLHAVVSVLAEACGGKPPPVEELVHKLHQRKSALRESEEKGGQFKNGGGRVNGQGGDDGQRRPSRSGERHKEHRQPRDPEREHAYSERMRSLTGRLGQDLEEAINEGRISAERAKDNRAAVESVLQALPEDAIARVHANTAGFHWYRSEADVNEAFHAGNPQDSEVPAAGFYDQATRTLHFADTDPELAAHELAHAMDGPKNEITRSEGWQAAYRMEKGEVNPGHATRNPQEWWAALVEVALTDAKQWQELKDALPESTRIVEEYTHGR